jgi:predicted nucleic acid binding AN1-type Zn finger protein
MGSVIDPYERKDDNNFNKALVCAIPDCQSKPTNQCPICSNYFCYEHIKSHIHPSEFPPIQNEKENIYKMK